MTKQAKNNNHNAKHLWLILGQTGDTDYRATASIEHAPDGANRRPVTGAKLPRSRRDHPRAISTTISSCGVQKAKVRFNKRCLSGPQTPVSRKIPAGSSNRIIIKGTWFLLYVCRYPSIAAFHPDVYRQRSCVFRATHFRHACLLSTNQRLSGTTYVPGASASSTARINQVRATVLVMKSSGV